MQNLIFSLNATLPVFLVMVVGYALGQLGFLPPAFCKASDRLTFKVTLPLMLFLDMGSVDTTSGPGLCCSALPPPSSAS